MSTSSMSTSKNKYILVTIASICEIKFDKIYFTEFAETNNMKFITYENSILFEFKNEIPNLKEFIASLLEAVVKYSQPIVKTIVYEGTTTINDVFEIKFKDTCQDVCRFIY